MQPNSAAEEQFYRYMRSRGHLPSQAQNATPTTTAAEQSNPPTYYNAMVVAPAPPTYSRHAEASSSVSPTVPQTRTVTNRSSLFTSRRTRERRMREEEDYERLRQAMGRERAAASRERELDRVFTESQLALGIPRRDIRRPENHVVDPYAVPPDWTNRFQSGETRGQSDGSETPRHPYFPAQSSSSPYHRDRYPGGSEESDNWR